MKRTLALLSIATLLCAIAATGCNKEPEVGYGGEVQTAPGGKAPPPGAKPGGGGMTPSLD
jgi:predicted small secreted protein